MRWMCGKRLLDRVPIKELQRMTKLTPIYIGRNKNKEIKLVRSLEKMFFTSQGNS